MQILEWGDLTEDQRAEAALIDWSDWNGPALVGLLHDPWLHGRPYQGYTSLVAVEGGRVLARVGTVRVSFRDRSGADPVLGVADVITDPRRLREGLATRLMEEVHRRARSDGLRASFLGTRVSWGAHRAYEKLGYRDVYSPPRSLRSAPRGPGRCAQVVAGMARPFRRSSSGRARVGWACCPGRKGGSSPASGSDGAARTTTSSSERMERRSGTRTFPAASGR